MEGNQAVYISSVKLEGKGWWVGRLCPGGVGCESQVLSQGPLGTVLPQRTPLSQALEIWEAAGYGPGR